MVYCSRVDAFSDYALYDYGASPDDLSGRVRIYADERHYSIEHAHKGVSERALKRVWLKYKASLSERVFPERMAIQIG